MSVKITIPNWHPATVNQLLGHWSIAHRRKKADCNIIRCYTQHLEKAEVKRLVRLTIILGKGQRTCDPDAYWKSLLDALVQAGQLVDDSVKWCVYEYPSFERGEMATIIELFDYVKNGDSYSYV
jgi:Holliday junction resolvase RusA-like endonuclease